MDIDSLHRLAAKTALELIASGAEPYMIVPVIRVSEELSRDSSYHRPTRLWQLPGIYDPGEHNNLKLPLYLSEHGELVGLCLFTRESSERTTMWAYAYRVMDDSCLSDTSYTQLRQRLQQALSALRPS